MRNNRVLGAAVAAALFLPIGSAYGGSYNVNNSLLSMPAADTAAGDSVVTSCSVTDGMGTCVVNSSFDLVPSTVVNVPDDGLIYATELFNTPPSGMEYPILPCGTEPAAIMFTIDGENDNDNTLATFTLSSGKFENDPVLGISDSNGAITSPMTIPDGGGDGSNFVKYNIDTTNGRLQVNDQLILTYFMQDASTLGTAGNTIKMTMVVKGSNTREEIIATSKEGLPLTGFGPSPQEEGKVQIDVTNDNKTFATGEEPAYIDSQTAMICYLNLETNSGNDDEYIVQCDGKSEFKLGSGDLTINEDQSKLEITGTQFQASTGSEMVYLSFDESATFGKDIIAVVDPDTFDATFSFTNQNMNDAGDLGHEMPLIMEVDGVTEIGIVEEAPIASLMIDFEQGNDENVDTWAMADIGPIESPCLLIRRNGMVCNVFNVPPSTAQDILNLRITNESVKAGKLTMTLYNMDGTVVGDESVVLVESLEPGHTVRFTSAMLEGEDYFNTTWTGRARLEIRSTLDKIEMFTLLRYQGDAKLLTNVSLGASGVACSQ